MQYEEPTIDYTLFNADKSLMKATIDMIPSTKGGCIESCLPFGITVKPYGDLPSVCKHFLLFSY